MIGANVEGGGLSTTAPYDFVQVLLGLDTNRHRMTRSDIYNSGEHLWKVRQFGERMGNDGVNNAAAPLTPLSI